MEASGGGGDMGGDPKIKISTSLQISGGKECDRFELEFKG